MGNARCCSAAFGDILTMPKVLTDDLPTALEYHVGRGPAGARLLVHSPLPECVLSDANARRSYQRPPITFFVREDSDLG